MNSSEDNAQRIREVTLGFARRLPDRIARIIILWGSCRRDGDNSALPVLRAEVHKLKGTAATYGYLSLSAVLAEIEAILIQTCEEDAFASPAFAARIEAGITALRNRDWTPDMNPEDMAD